MYFKYLMRLDRFQGCPIYRAGEQELGCTATVTYSPADAAPSSSGIFRVTNRNLIWSGVCASLPSHGQTFNCLIRLSDMSRTLFVTIVVVVVLVVLVVLLHHTSTC